MVDDVGVSVGGTEFSGDGIGLASAAMMVINVDVARKRGTVAAFKDLADSIEVDRDEWMRFKVSNWPDGG